jgi:hypothetical protein
MPNANEYREIGEVTMTSSKVQSLLMAQDGEGVGNQSAGSGPKPSAKRCLVASLALVFASQFGLGCEGQPVTEEAQESQQMLVPDIAQSDVLGFEVAGAWSTTTAGAVLAQSTKHTQGSYSLSVRPSNSNGFTPIKSIPLSTLSTVSPTLAVDIMLPTYQPNPYYYGAAQAYLNCPSRNIYSQFLSQVELTGKPLNVWNTVTFPVSNAMVTGLLQAGYTDLTITVVLNVQAPTTGIYNIDNLRFVPQPANRCGGMPNGTSCTDANACTQGDTCQAGVCRAGTAVVCPGADQCNTAGTCNPSTGACSPVVRKSDGTPCNDGNACTQVDACQAGVCTGTVPVVCTVSDVCHDLGACNPATGVCTNPAKTGDAACIDDLMPLSVGNTCSTITPMGTRFESAHVATAADLAFLASATDKPALPYSGWSWDVFPVDIAPSGSPVPADENQGLEDCDGVATMAELAYLAPHFIETIVLDNHDNTYSVKVYDPTGAPITVVLNNQFPKDTNGHLGAAKGKDGLSANWATLLENAVMKYIHVWPEVSGSINGIAKEVVAPIMLGKGCSFAFNKNVLSSADIRRVLEVSLRHGSLVVGGFGKKADGSNLTLNNFTLPNPHAWSGFWPNDDLTMISFRNPWGHNDYATGGGSDGSRDGVLDVPLAPLAGIQYEQYIDIRVMEPGAAGTAGRTTPYVYP